MSKIQESVKTLQKELKKDKKYRETWSSNIAMSFYDSYMAYKKKTGKKNLSNQDIITVANDASESFLKLLCDEVKYPEGR